MLASSIRCFPAPWTRSFAVLTLRASQFEHILGKVGVTQEAYAGNPLAALSFSKRGLLLQAWAKRFLAEKYPDLEMLPPQLGECIDGRKRSMHTAEYDIIFGGRRVELKSAQLCCSTSGFWATWRGVKFPAFDDLYLTLLSPDGLRLFKHDLNVGLSTDGQRTMRTGYIVRVYGGPNHRSWEAATEKVLHTLCHKGSCSQIGYSEVGDSIVQEILSENKDAGSMFYTGKPFASLNGAARGIRMQEVVFEVDQMLNTNSTFSFPHGEETYLGPSWVRSRANATSDWIRDGARIETKHSKLRFNTTTQRWECDFCNIKPDLFDELLLAVYSPSGIFVFVSTTCLPLSTQGVSTDVSGHWFRVGGPKHELDPSRSLETIFAKLSRLQCQHVATILWD